MTPTNKTDKLAYPGSDPAQYAKPHLRWLPPKETHPGSYPVWYVQFHLRFTMLKYTLTTPANWNLYRGRGNDFAHYAKPHMRLYYVKAHIDDPRQTNLMSPAKRNSHILRSDPAQYVQPHLRFYYVKVHIDDAR